MIRPRKPGQERRTFLQPVGSVRQPASLPGMCSEGQRWLVVTLGAQCSDSYQITGGSTEKQQWNACICFRGSESWLHLHSRMGPGPIRGAARFLGLAGDWGQQEIMADVALPAHCPVCCTPASIEGIGDLQSRSCRQPPTAPLNSWAPGFGKGRWGLALQGGFESAMCPLRARGQRKVRVG